MIMFILGIIDIIAAISLFFVKWNLLISVAWIATGIIFVKAIAFIKSFASIMDLIIVVISVLALLGIMYNIATYIAIVWLLQKGISSFF